MSEATRKLQGRTAIITGGGSGIGDAIARRFAAEGAHVVIVDKDGSVAQRLAGEIEAAGGSARAYGENAVSAATATRIVAEAAAANGSVDVLVNNVGGYRALRKTWEIEEAEWDEIVSLNLKTAFLWSKAAIPLMLARSRGRIVSLTSGAGKPGAGNTLSASHYAASKAAIRGFTWHLAHELAPHGITANAIAPGPANTERFRQVRSPEDTAKLVARIPMHRLAEPHEIADAALFLASDAASYITGITLDVSGGWVMS